jgi:hypothetical protein
MMQYATATIMTIGILAVDDSGRSKGCWWWCSCGSSPLPPMTMTRPDGGKGKGLHATRRFLEEEEAVDEEEERQERNTSKTDDG